MNDLVGSKIGTANPSNLLRMLQSRSDTLQHAVAVTLLSGLPFPPPPSRRAFDMVLQAGTQPEDLDDPKHATLLSATTWALLNSGHPNEALEMAEHRALPALLRAASDTSEDAQSAGYSAMAETFLLHGRLAEAVSAAHIAAEYARDLDNHKFRALALAAAGHAHNGEAASAVQMLTEAAEADKGRGWVKTFWPAVWTNLQLARQGGDTMALRQALNALKKSPNQPLLNRAVARLGQVWLQKLTGDYRSAVATAEPMIRGVNARAIPPFLADLAVSSQIYSLVQLADPGAALALIGGRESSPTHAVCFELLHAEIYLLLEDPRKALAVTDNCINSCPHHSLLTLPSVLARRAVAHELLGHHALADTSFSRATHLGVELSSLKPAFGIPLDILKRLHARLLVNEPEFGSRLSADIPTAETYTARMPLPFKPAALTDRERVLASWLPSNLTFASIADELHVSNNTIKTHAKSLYKKLGANTRAEAVHRLEATGLIPPPQH